MRQPSVMRHTFSQVPHANIPRSSFDRSHGHKTTLNAGLLVPIFIDEALPGDTFNVNMTGFARLSTPLKPYMDNAYFTTFFFAVPKRLLWANWEKFNGEQANPGDSTDFLVPETVAPDDTGFLSGSFYDYCGLPVGVPGIRVSALPNRAYRLIFNEWFRDQNLQNAKAINLGDGPDAVNAQIGPLFRRGKRHDYFTSCLPWPQKGESVSIPLGTTAGVYADPNTSPSFYFDATTNDYVLAQTSTSSARFAAVGGTGSPPASDLQMYWRDPALFTDLSTATAATINQLRQAFQIQKLYERDARGGSRYTEILRSHFGVISPDARLQRPEYLGGGRSDININPVAQTQRSDADESPQGNLAAYGTSVMHGHGFSKSFTEHCVLMGLICITADLTYQQGINRMWSRRGRFDYYWPALAHIGEQAVLNQEIFADGTAADQDVFGYQERYAEYRYKPSIITGKFRSSDAQSLDVWHLSQDFETRPLLNETFIQENPPFERVVAVPSEPHFIADFYFKMRCVRPMPVFGVPGLIDHF